MRRDPFVAVLGGAKVSDKLGVLEALIERVDALLIGGAMANTFLAARGVNMGKSRVEDDKLALARSIMQRAEERGVKLLLAADVVVAGSLEAERGDVGRRRARARGRRWRSTSARRRSRRHRRAILPAKALFWNGPMGLFESPAFARGSLGVAQAVRRLRRASPWSAAATASRP